MYSFNKNDYHNDRISEKFSVFSNDNSEIFFSGSINNESMCELVKELKKVESHLLKVFDESMKKINKKIDAMDQKYFDIDLKPYIHMKPIRLIINSPGGYVYDAFFAVDVIKTLKVDVHTVVSGYCASAGTLLSLAGKHRFITKNANMLIHEIRAGFWGKKTSVNDEYENLNKISKQLIDYYKSNTKLKEEKLEEILKRDCNWSPQECLEAGLVDEII
jgi:ATP-dependent Clp endopeptidase proteolytic subunit ClpP